MRFVLSGAWEMKKSMMEEVGFGRNSRSCKLLTISASSGALCSNDSLGCFPEKAFLRSSVLREGSLIQRLTNVLRILVTKIAEDPVSLLPSRGWFMLDCWYSR